jgi:serine phosphatase RsbU (regulator of sigma subunit)
VGASHFVACALAIVEPPGLLRRGPRIKLSNAAQVPVLLCRGGKATELEAPGDRLPLGVRPDGDYQDVTAELHPGDVVIFSSDGLPEAPAQAQVHLATSNAAGLAPPEKPGELFGFDRLQQSAAWWSTEAQSAEAIAEGIWSDLTAWCGSESHHDDMTLLVLWVPASAASGTAVPIPSAK